jgi:hypothetical protein
VARPRGKPARENPNRDFPRRLFSSGLATGHRPSWQPSRVLTSPRRRCAFIPRWCEIYQGEDEWQFFVGTNGRGGLVRGPAIWRSLGELTREAGLRASEVREIVDRYLALHVIVAGPQGLAYWERVAPIRVSS